MNNPRHIWLTQQDETFIKKTFGVNWPQLRCKWLTMTSGQMVLDVLALDDLLHRQHGYREDTHGSMADFIRLTWGEGALAQTERLMTTTNYLPIKLDK